jgi:hypothetical protein
MSPTTIVGMGSWGKVIGGDYMSATVSTNRKGELALSPLGFKRTPNLTADTIASWEEVFPEKRGGAKDAISKVGQAVSLATLRGPAGKAAAAAVGSAADLVGGSNHTIRVRWMDGKQSMIQLPDEQFQHLAILLGDLQIPSEAPTQVAAPDQAQTPGVISQLTKLAGVVRPTQPDAADQIARLAELRDQGVLTDAEFTAKKAEILGLGAPAASTAAPPPPGVAVPPPPPAAISPPPPPPTAITPPPPPATPSQPALAGTPVATPPGSLTPPPIPASPPPPTGLEAPTPPAPPPPQAVTPPPPSAPAAWVPDPHGRHELRYWDGTAWTGHVSSGGVQTFDPA